MRRRKIRRYRPGKENSVMKFTIVFGIILCAVLCGYLTARYVVGPLLGFDTEVLKLDFPSKLITGLEKDSTKKENDRMTSEGYVLQFGVFSSESGAETLLDQLKKNDINAKIKEEDGSYKVISDTITTKEEALQQLERLKDENNIDVFIDTVD